MNKVNFCIWCILVGYGPSYITDPRAFGINAVSSSDLFDAICILNSGGIIE